MRFVWLHGFASGPGSSKGQFVKARLAERGAELALPDLNQPAFFSLTVSRMLEQVDALAPEVLFGSSLGGFTAATWAATRGAKALVLLAPAFDLGHLWQNDTAPADLTLWRETGRLAFEHYAYGRKEDLGIGFLDDALAHDPWPLPACPTLVIQGQRDEVVPPHLAREFTRRMNGRGRLVELDQGHELNADLPGLWRLVEDFLQPWLPRPTP